MMKKHFSLIVIILLTGCYPCEFLDWNCNRGIDNTGWGKKVNRCEEEQLHKALQKEPYSRKLHIKIIEQCTLSNGNYKYHLNLSHLK